MTKAEYLFGVNPNISIHILHTKDDKTAKMRGLQ